MAVDTLEMAQAMRQAGLPREQADVIAEQIGKGFASDELATKKFVRAEIAGPAHRAHQEMGNWARCTRSWACSPGRWPAYSCSRRAWSPR